MTTQLKAYRQSDIEKLKCITERRAHPQVGGPEKVYACGECGVPLAPKEFVRM